MSFTKLVNLLETLLANEDKLVDKTEGKSKGKANQKSYAMETIRATFPSEKESYGVHCQGTHTTHNARNTHNTHTTPQHIHNTYATHTHTTQK